MGALLFCVSSPISSAAKTPSGPAKVAKSQARALYTVDPQRSRVIVRMTHSVLGRFDTQAQGLKGQILVGAAEIELKTPLELAVSALQSMVPLRDRHMRDYLEADKYPVVALKSLKWNSQTQEFQALLRVRNVDREVSEKVSLQKESEWIRAQTQFPLRLSTFSIEVPKYMGVGVEDSFLVFVDLWAREDLDESDLEGL
jgi:polyisoprenoid-binding protein YceI